MVVEALSDIVFWFIGLLFDGFSIISLPTNLITAVVDIMKYGIWILGLDLFVIVWSSIIFWIMFKLSAGILLFVWRLLPLT